MANQLFDKQLCMNREGPVLALLQWRLLDGGWKRMKKITEDLAARISFHVESSQTFPEFAEKLVKLLAEAFSCQWAALWKVDGSVLRLVYQWQAENLNAGRLNQDSRDRTFYLNEGTAGQVWRSRQVIWSTDIVSDMCLPRSIEATEAGLSGGIWIPVQVQTTVFGVIELLAADLLPSNATRLLAVESLSFALGDGMQRFERKLASSR
jgi:hypothetical protein